MNEALIKKLSTKKGRIDEGLFLVEGKIPVEALINSDYHVENIYSVDGTIGEQIDEEAAKLISNVADPQNFFAIAKLPTESKKISNGKWLLLDGVQDPGNLGTILRTANSFKYTGVALTKRAADLYSDKVLRAAKGANFTLDMITDIDAKNFIQEARDKNLHIYGTIISDEAKPLSKVKKTDDNFVLILGNEGVGVDKSLSSLIDENINIEMPGNQDSLNVAIAGSILMYELDK